MPSGAQEYSEWIRAGAHLAFLREYARADEVVVYAAGGCTFIHALVVPEDQLSPPDVDDLLHWSANPYSLFASYVYGGQAKRVSTDLSDSALNGHAHKTY